ncbi:FAD/NAD-P-binding domain-containing protein [Trametes elegans]|nr:FAD/NAD-P-binding domain-containing protein [Trametes elegans]
MPRPNVAIVGAGLCGLVMAIALERYAPDVDFTVYEAAAELSTVGAGVGMQPRTWFTLRELGLEDALLKIAGDGKQSKLTMLYRKGDQRDGFTIAEASLDDQKFATFHRAELQKTFLENIRGRDRIHLGKRLASYVQHQNGEVEIRFQDGTSTTCDLLVGCDGIKSRVRSVLYTQLADAAQEAGRAAEAEELRSCIPAVFAGVVAYRGVIRRDIDEETEGKPRPLNASHLCIYLGKNKHLVAYPMTQGHTRLLNISAVVVTPELYGITYEGPWVEEVPKEEATSFYAGWEPEAEEIMTTLNDWHKWVINVVKDLPTYVGGGVVLVGDSAHAMTPHQGAGAGQGFEDATMLARLLAESPVDQAALPIALKVYDERRRPVAQQVSAFSLRSGRLHSFIAPELTSVTEELSASGQGMSIEQLKKLAADLEDIKAWQKVTTIASEYDTAVERLREELKSELRAIPTEA